MLFARANDDPYIGYFDAKKDSSSVRSRHRIVDEVNVKYGQSIALGEPVLRIKSDQLENEYEALVAEQIENEQRRKEIELHLLRSSDLTIQQRSSLEGELQTLQVVAKTHAERISLLQQQLERLVVRAKFQGIVGTWNIDTQLANKPVAFGQTLATIYDPESEWEFELELEEKDLSAFLSHTESNKSPVIKCRMDVDPLHLIDLQWTSQSHQFVLHKTSDGRLVVPILATVDVKQVHQLTPGATATAEIVTGKQPIIWVLTRDLILNTWAKVRLWI